MGDAEKTVPEPAFAARNGVPSALLHNRGDGTFADVTARAERRRAAKSCPPRSLTAGGALVAAVRPRCARQPWERQRDAEVRRSHSPSWRGSAARLATAKSPTDGESDSSDTMAP